MGFLKRFMCYLRLKNPRVYHKMQLPLVYRYELLKKFDNNHFQWLSAQSRSLMHSQCHFFCIRNLLLNSQLTKMVYIHHTIHHIYNSRYRTNQMISFQCTYKNIIGIVL